MEFDIRKPDSMEIVKIHTDTGIIILEPGTKFTHDNISGQIEVVKVLSKVNELVVNITYKESSQPHHDIWNLQHVVWAFERNEYVKINEPA